MEKKIKILNLESALPSSIEDRMQCKLMSGVKKLEEALGESIYIENVFYLEMENTEKQEVYNQLVIKCKDDWYYTCSSSFTQDITDCFDEVADCEGNFAYLKVIPISVPSRNNSGSFYKAKFVGIQSRDEE